MTENVDAKDLKLLELLQNNSKLTSSQISKKTGLPITTVHNRIKKLEKNGVIKKYSLELNKNKLGLNITTYIFASIDYPREAKDSKKKFSQEDIAKKIRSLTEVDSVSIVTGETDLIIKVSTQNIDSLNEFIIKKLRNIDGIDKTRTAVILKEY